MSKYEETSRDIRSLIREEANAARRQALQGNLDKIDSEWTQMRETVTNLRIAAASTLSSDAVKRIAEDGVKVVATRVDALEWLVRGVIVATALEIVGGVFLAIIVHGLGLAK